MCYTNLIRLQERQALHQLMCSSICLFLLLDKHLLFFPFSLFFFPLSLNLWLYSFGNILPFFLLCSFHLHQMCAGPYRLCCSLQSVSVEQWLVSEGIPCAAIHLILLKQGRKPAEHSPHSSDWWQTRVMPTSTGNWIYIKRFFSCIK